MPPSITHLSDHGVMVGVQGQLLRLPTLALDHCCLAVTVAAFILEININAAGGALYQPQDVLLQSSRRTQVVCIMRSAAVWALTRSLSITTTTTLNRAALDVQEAPCSVPSTAPAPATTRCQSALKSASGSKSPCLAGEGSCRSRDMLVRAEHNRGWIRRNSRPLQQTNHFVLGTR